jgi:Zn ribbon nucleic-acid-binding protein
VLGLDRTTDPALAHYEFDIMIEKGKAEAMVSSLQADDFLRTLNPRKFLAELEMWIEDEAEEVRCPFCGHPVKLIRIPIPQPQAGANSPGAGPSNPLAQMLQQFQQGAGPKPGGPFQLGNQPPGFGQNRAAIQTIFDSKLSDQELIDILGDLGIGSTTTTTRNDLLTAFLDHLYQ